jgi:hypothetical protein
MKWAEHVACMEYTRNTYTFWLEMYKERDLLKGLGVDGMRVKKLCWRCGLDTSESASEADFCRHVYELMASIKHGHFLTR